MGALGLHGAGEEECEQQKNIATAANKITTLQNFVLSSLPPADKISHGKRPIPHFDYKEKAREWMKKNTPDLVKKTTLYWPGWYAQNLIYLPAMKFMPVVSNNPPPLRQKNMSVCIYWTAIAGARSMLYLGCCATTWMKPTTRHKG